MLEKSRMPTRFRVKEQETHWRFLVRSRFGLAEFMEKKTANLVLSGFFIALIVVLTRFLAIETTILRISLEFIPIALSAVFFGPIIGALTAALSDVVGMLAFPKAPYFPGFTVSAAIYGFIYGMFLYGRPIQWKNTLAAVFLNILIVDFILVAVWLHIMYQIPYEALLVTRTIKCAVFFPLQLFLLRYGLRKIKEALPR